MSDRFDRALSLALTVAAVVIAGVLVYREFLAPKPQPQGISRDPVFVEEWDTILRHGQLVGRQGALLHIVEFGDFECPFCARFHQSYSTFRQLYGDDVALTYVHYPLSNHAFAMPAARASECAAAQGKFSEFIDLVYREQDSLGHKNWVLFASGAGVADTGGFARCMADTTLVPRIAEGIRLGDMIRIRGTPTILVNGWRYPAGPPTQAQLVQLMDSLRAGIDPFRGLKRKGSKR